MTDACIQNNGQHCQHDIWTLACVLYCSVRYKSQYFIFGLYFEWIALFHQISMTSNSFLLQQVHDVAPLPLRIGTKCFSLGIKTNFFCEHRQPSCLVDLFTPFSSKNVQCSILGSLWDVELFLGHSWTWNVVHIPELLLEGLWIHPRLALFAIRCGFIFNLGVTRNTCFCVQLVFTSVKETA